MDAATRQNALASAREQVAGLLDENWVRIIEDMYTSAIAFAESHPDGGTFKFNVSCGVTLEPRGAECAVSAKVRWSVAHSDETDGAIVSPQMELPMTGGEEG